jgi:hypothetical protein
MEVFLDIQAPVVTQGKRPIEGGMRNGTPQVDNLKAACKQGRHVSFGQMSLDTCDG